MFTPTNKRIGSSSSNSTSTTPRLPQLATRSSSASSTPTSGSGAASSAFTPASSASTRTSVSLPPIRGSISSTNGSSATTITTTTTTTTTPSCRSSSSSPSSTTTTTTATVTLARPTSQPALPTLPAWTTWLQRVHVSPDAHAAWIQLLRDVTAPRTASSSFASSPSTLIANPDRVDKVQAALLRHCRVDGADPHAGDPKHMIEPVAATATEEKHSDDQHEEDEDDEDDDEEDDDDEEEEDSDDEDDEHHREPLTEVEDIVHNVICVEAALHDPPGPATLLCTFCSVRQRSAEEFACSSCAYDQAVCSMCRKVVRLSELEDPRKGAAVCIALVSDPVLLARTFPDLDEDDEDERDAIVQQITLMLDAYTATVQEKAKSAATAVPAAAAKSSKR